MSSVPPPPWTVDCRGVVWLAPGRRRELPGGRALAVLGGAVRYSATPVGEYAELLALAVSHTGRRPWAQVPFMAVDSEDSLEAGRESWGLPKTLASFDGEPEAHLVARGDDPAPWLVEVSARARGPRLPVRLRGWLEQPAPDAGVLRTRVRVRGRLSPALVAVDSTGTSAPWLPAGRRPGALVSLRLTIGSPARVTPAGRGRP